MTGGAHALARAVPPSNIRGPRVGPRARFLEGTEGIRAVSLILHALYLSVALFGVQANHSFRLPHLEQEELEQRGRVIGRQNVLR